MIEFRDRMCAELGVRLIVHSNRAAIENGANPLALGVSNCCGLRNTPSGRAPGRGTVACEGANLFGRINSQESVRVFPLSNWTELDIWRYIEREQIPVVPLYFAKEREILIRGELLIPVEPDPPRLAGERPVRVLCRMRALGCTYCTGAIRSDADKIPKIIEELKCAVRSERENRRIDHDRDGSMELKKREGYF